MNARALMMTEQNEWLPGATTSKTTKNNLKSSTAINPERLTQSGNISDPEPDFAAGAEHLASFTVDPIEGEGDDFGGMEGITTETDTEAGEMGEGAPPGEFIGPEAFFVGFCTAFNLTSLIPPYVKSLKIEITEMQQARAASDEMYEICLETPGLHFIIQPGGVWYKRLSVIGMFMVPKVMGVAKELREKRIAAQNAALWAEKKPAGANDAKPANDAPAGEKQAGASDPVDWAPAA
ncbi:hypothetical protein [Thalassospira marina]|nr:hypothetical protein [Thalassospira marina]